MQARTNRETERDRGATILAAVERRIAEVERRQEELLLEIADAEERGDWPLAARLRMTRLSERAVRMRLGGE